MNIYAVGRKNQSMACGLKQKKPLIFRLRAFCGMDGDFFY